MRERTTQMIGETDELFSGINGDIEVGLRVRTESSPRLLMVGPTRHERKLLRQTEGERFMAFSKRIVLRENFGISKRKIGAMQKFLTIKILLYVITYPLALELFALENAGS